MIREWCVCCGDRLGPNSKSDTYCNYCRGFSGETRDEWRAQLCAKEEVFWKAIAHERAATTNAVWKTMFGERKV